VKKIFHRTCQKNFENFVPLSVQLVRRCWWWLARTCTCQMTWWSTPASWWSLLTESS